ncbi:hypothetical protein K437DRAFT_255716 [Tilletiaria anomala UBC 951]|uniref:Secreted protein n=1 Tax=Tilletiaria anomala (strain ATCC 24038 / CBS 436.72 / UBC 951) TaxID=1037660 RepID=A0A066W204_TILAU|nr:uncharacterized protein K437DRAFT_255716 [Tilletiaria anomala UBC 951]KDN47987.1 hypothetical protein K437DRAFT_255716 [Tilletiaria anomala UBC 951]
MPGSLRLFVSLALLVLPVHGSGPLRHATISFFPFCLRGEEWVAGARSGNNSVYPIPRLGLPPAPLSVCLSV